jgi:hypothetical protein
MLGWVNYLTVRYRQETAQGHKIVPRKLGLLEPVDRLINESVRRTKT